MPQAVEDRRHILLTLEIDRTSAERLIMISIVSVEWASRLISILQSSLPWTRLDNPGSPDKGERSEVLICMPFVTLVGADDPCPFSIELCLF